jgi:hypothetical protein
VFSAFVVIDLPHFRPAELDRADVDHRKSQEQERKWQSAADSDPQKRNGQQLEIATAHKTVRIEKAHHDEHQKCEC